MATFRVILKRTYFAEVEIEAESAAEIRRLLADSSDAALDYMAAANSISGDEIKVAKVERLAATA